MKFKSGDRIKYISGRHGDTKSNPLWAGRQGYVLGTVDSAGGSYIGVSWDNGHHNSYSSCDLELHEHGPRNPNIEFKILKGVKR